MTGSIGALLINGCLLGGVALMVRALCRSWRRVDQWLAVAIVGFTSIIVSMQVASAFGAIGRTFAWSLALCWLACGLVITAIRSRRPDRASSHGLGAGDPALSHTGLPTRIGYGLLIVASVWATLYYVLQGWTEPVAPVSDAPIYHLFFAIRWWKAGAITLVPTPFGEESAPYFPANGDLWLTWLLACAGDDRLARIGQAPFALITVAALWRLARFAGADARAATAPAWLWLCTPVFLTSVGLANVDLIFTAYYLASASFLIRFVEDRRLGLSGNASLSMMALASGIALGTKATGIPFVPLLLAPALSYVVQSRHRWRQGAMLVFGLSVPCVYWYGRNLGLTGNPIYPLDLSVSGVSIFPGLHDSAAMRTSTYHVPIDQWWRLTGYLGLAMGPLLQWLWLASIALGIAQWFRRGAADRSAPRVGAVCSVLALLHCVIYALVIPYNTQFRFLLPAFALGMVPIARVLTARPWLSMPIAGMATLQLLPVPGLSFFVAGHAPLLPIGNDLLALGSLWRTFALPVAIALSVAIVTRKRWWGWPTALVLVAVACRLGSEPLAKALAAKPLAAFYSFRGDFSNRISPAWIVLDSASGAGARVAYAGTNLPYYLFGVGLRNEVRYVNVDRHADWAEHDYHHDGGSPWARPIYDHPWPQLHRAHPNYDDWLANLRAANIDLLFVARENMHGKAFRGPGPAPYPIERAWAQAHPESFTFLGPRFDPNGPLPQAMVYRVSKDAEGESGLLKRVPFRQESARARMPSFVPVSGAMLTALRKHARCE